MDNMPALTHQQRTVLAQANIPMEVSAFEREIIIALREYSFGTMEIHVRDSIPYKFSHHKDQMLFTETNSKETLNIVKNQKKA